MVVILEACFCNKFVTAAPHCGTAFLHISGILDHCVFLRDKSRNRGCYMAVQGYEF